MRSHDTRARCDTPARRGMPTASPSLALIGLILGLLVLASCRPASEPPDAEEPAGAREEPVVAAPTLEEFLPTGYRAAGITAVDMDGDGVDELVLTAVATAGRVGPDRLLLRILAWDASAGRWTVVFDGAEHPTTAADGSSEVVLPAYVSADDLTVTPMSTRPEGGTDVAFWANTTAGTRAVLRLGVVRLENRVASLLYWFQGTGSGAVSLLGGAHDQRIAVTSAWHTDADPGCCPSRDHHFEVAPVGDGYQVVRDDRPLVGIWVVYGRPDSRELATVVRVVPGTPADGRLLPGDVLLGVAGGPPVSGPRIGPAVIGQIAQHQPDEELTLQVLRRGVLTPVAIRLDTHASVSPAEAAPTPAYLGVTLTDGPDGHGPSVTMVEPGSPADIAGITPRSRLERVGDTPVLRPDDVRLAMYAHADDFSVDVRYVDPGGSRHMTTVWLDGHPAQPDGSPTLL